jgi:hypothetical protein
MRCKVEVTAALIARGIIEGKNIPRKERNGKKLSKQPNKNMRIRG